MSNQPITNGNTNNIILHSVTPDQLKEMLVQLIREEFLQINREMQKVLGEDDLISTGTACRLLGMCAKMLKYLIDEGQFTVFYHMKERRFKRSEILEYRNKYRSEKRNR